MYAAITFGICNQLNLDIKESIDNIEMINVIPGRMQAFIGRKKCLVISDSYNANYHSMRNGIEYLFSLRHSRKILILGSMLELGTYTETEHKNIAKSIVGNNCELLTIGDAVSFICSQLKVINPNVPAKVFYSFEHLVLYLNKMTYNEDLAFYIKGSGRMRLELVTQYLLGEPLRKEMESIET